MTGEQKVDFFCLFVSFGLGFLCFQWNHVNEWIFEELKEAEGGSDEADRKVIDMYRCSKRYLFKLAVHMSLLYMYMLLKYKLRIFWIVMSADWHNCLFPLSTLLTSDCTHNTVLILPDFQWHRETVYTIFCFDVLLQQTYLLWKLDI